ncbi:glutaminase A [Elizabethkingia sp. JS20170427COW]|uniref:glutaminase A n=1 Tax=Elizabethkingia sp. JS20170427COW TaxID=2583851 RepID=UPI0011101836|nr:glutaminase A [Elizabethkingia sp. JS20170427COW]QCX53648.1 glutaminase A [Elizabethkingia sp. JS20170427COW]
MKNFIYSLFFICSSTILSAQHTYPKDSLQQLLHSTLVESKSYIEKGKVADYIPELSKADKNKLGIALIDKQGKLYTLGDVHTKFTIQSISKIIALMIAVQERGEAYIFSRMGYYGTDQAFNSMEALNTRQKPLNPMMNAGAIATTASIIGNGDEAYQKILKMIRFITNNDSIKLNEAVYLSEKETGNRNRSMFYLEKNFGLFDAKGEESLNNYFKQCSIEVDAVDLAKIGYFFAHNCTRFDGDKTYYNPEMAELINSIMLTAGMYNYSGEYSRKVGIPSKSGVGGGILGSVPGKYGIGTFNPALDTQGNSAAGLYIFEKLSKKLALSIFR